jgi:hypothetical protein
MGLFLDQPATLKKRNSEALQFVSPYRSRGTRSFPIPGSSFARFVLPLTHNCIAAQHSVADGESFEPDSISIRRLAVRQRLARITLELQNARDCAPST